MVLHVNTSSDDSISSIIGKTRSVLKGDQTDVSTLLKPLGEISHSALLVFPALLVVTPLSGLPGVSSVCGIVIALFSLQMILGCDSLWLPKRLLKLKIDNSKLDTALKSLQKASTFVDRYTRRRFGWLVRRPGSLVTQTLCFICGCAMPFLELIPFTSSILGAAISLFAISLVARDGALATVGYIVVGAAIFLVMKLAT